MEPLLVRMLHVVVCALSYCTVLKYSYSSQLANCLNPTAAEVNQQSKFEYFVSIGSLT